MAIRVDKKNRLYYDFYCFTPDGRKIRCREWTGLKDTSRNRSAAEAKDKAIHYELTYGRFNYFHFFPHGRKAGLFGRPQGRMLFSKWWDEWLGEKNLRPNTARGWNSTYRHHLDPHFGHRALHEITEHEILVFRKMLEGKGLKASSINDKIIKPLCMCLYRAHKRGLIDTYPCKEIGRLAEIRPDIDPFSFDDLNHFLDVVRRKAPEYYDMLFIWSRTGVRPGELYALKWSRLDAFNQRLLIRETRYPSGNEGPPKTTHSIRDIPLRPQVLETFRRQEARTGLQGGHVFLTGANRPFSDAFMRKKFQHLCRLAGLPYRPPKQLRHTFATLHIAAGENITWVSQTLGHASVEVTLKKYNRFIPNLTRDDGSAFEKIMNGKAKEGQQQANIGQR